MATAVLGPVEISATHRIPTLDGWRGVAILLVLLDHTAQHSRFEHQLWGNLGQFGVDIFFVLSGYIITTRLIGERAKSSTINLRNFYWRRAFRILPLVTTYLVTLCLLSLFANLADFRASEIVSSAFFFRNYQFAANPIGIYTIHFWSLSIEEHFYLMWPALLLWFGNRRALWVSIVGAITSAVWRLYECSHAGRAIFPSARPDLHAIQTDARLDGLLLGCALALVLVEPRIRSFIARNLRDAPLLLAFLIFASLLVSRGFPSFITNVLVTIMLAHTLVFAEGVPYRWLNSRLLVWVGTVSYSVYVWQQLFLFHSDGILSIFPLNLACVFAVATCSFYFIERPAIAFGKRLRKQSTA